MSNRLTESCARELESYIEGLFKNARKFPGRLAAEVPVIGGLFLPDSDYAPLLLPVCRALCAREQFHQDAPGWPILPLRWQDCKDLEDDDNPRISLVGYFGESLFGECWDPKHPPFADFTSGLLAYEHTPDRIRNDRALQCEFPPRPLEGLCDGNLYWRTPASLARDRYMLARIAEWEADRAAERMS